MILEAKPGKSGAGSRAELHGGEDWSAVNKRAFPAFPIRIRKSKMGFNRGVPETSASPDAGASNGKDIKGLFQSNHAGAALGCERDGSRVKMTTTIRQKS